MSTMIQLRDEIETAIGCDDLTTYIAQRVATFPFTDYADSEIAAMTNDFTAAVAIFLHGMSGTLNDIVAAVDQIDIETIAMEYE